MTFFLFLLNTALLVTEGLLLARLLQKGTGLPLALTLALPLGAAGNYLLFLLFTILHIPLMPVALWLGHAVSIGMVLFLSRRLRSAQPQPQPRRAAAVADLHDNRLSLRKPLTIVCLGLLACYASFGFVHAVLLPSFPIDTFTNWTMRSRVSFEDQAMAFDTTEIRGVAKPQYPFLIHALQITAQQGGAWSDRSANAILFLLILSGFASVFLLLKRLMSADTALFTVTLLFSMPLVAFHLIPGYGDLPLALFLVLSLLTLLLAVQDAAWLPMASAFALAAAWTKTEGLIIGVVPFLLLLAWHLHTKHLPKRPALAAALVTVLLSLPHPLLLLFMGLPLSPHATDASLVWSPQALLRMPAALFASGSLGVSVTAVLIAFLLVVTKTLPARGERLWVLSWGLFALGVILFTYLFTPNVGFFLNEESFFRQMFVPLMLLMVGFSVCLRGDSPAQSPPNA